MEEWKEYELSELIDEISMGPFGSNIKVECFTDSGVPVLNGSNLVGLKLNEDKFNYVTEEKAASLGKANAYRNDIVITHRGTLGQIVYIPQNSKYDHYVISQSQFRVRCNQKVLPEYLVYYFHTRIGQHQLLSNASQVGVPALARPTTTFQKLRVILPPLPTQQKIAAIFSSLDDKIELNNKINTNLEQQSQALFKNWFVDFEPFGGKMPEGWKVGKLLELINVKYGKDHKKLNDGNYPVYGSGGIMRYVDKFLYDKESVLIPRKGTLNNVFYINEPFWSVDTMFYTEMKKENIAKYVYFFVKGKDLNAMNAGSAVPSMTTEILNAIEVVIPSDEYLEKFENIVSPMFKQIKQCIIENENLASIRDTLLPKLMNGEIEV